MGGCVSGKARDVCVGMETGGEVDFVGGGDEVLDGTGEDDEEVAAVVFLRLGFETGEAEREYDEGG